MKYICDGPNHTTWFRIETEGEAAKESQLMEHAVEKHFMRAREAAAKSFVPRARRKVEELIGLEDHIQRTMPLFLTLRDREGEGLATAMLPPGGKDDSKFRIIIVGKANGDPYVEHQAAIDALGAHFGLELDRSRCYPYRS